MHRARDRPPARGAPGMSPPLLRRRRRRPAASTDVALMLLAVVETALAGDSGAAFAERARLLMRHMQQGSVPGVDGAPRLGMETGVLLGCWDYMGRPRRRQVWSECCFNRSGYPPPRQRSWCWAPWRHQLGRTGSFEKCCEHTSEETADGIMFRHAQEVFATPGRDCPRPLAWVCPVAAERTRLARLTRRRAAALLAAGQLPDFGALRLHVPVLGFPVSHDPGGVFSLRLLRSIDFPVGRLVLVLNVQETADPPWMQEVRARFPTLTVIKSNTNLGCAGGWNSVVEALPSAPYWLILNNDVAFLPGMLKRIAEAMAESLESEAFNATGAGCSGEHRAGAPFCRRVGDADVSAPPRPQPEPPLLMRSFRLRSGKDNLPAFALTRRAVAEVGLFDENFWPVYGEDTDYLARMRILSKGVHVVDDTVELIHGPEDWMESSSGHYSGSEHFIRSQLAGGHSAAAAEAAETLAKQLESADNGKHFCLKYGPIERPDCAELEYEAVGPYGVPATGWDDWILDPFRRLCIMSLGRLCGYDVRLLHAPFRF